MQEILGYFNNQPDLVCPPIVEGEAVVYRTTWHPAGCPLRTPPEIAPGEYTIDLGAPDDARFIGWGWHGPEAVAGLTVRWTGEYPDAKLYLDLPPGAYQLSLSAQAFQRDRMLDIQVNGVSVGSQIVPAAGLTTLTYTLPAALVGDGQHVTLTLAYDGADAPPGATRKLALMVDWLRLRRVADVSTRSAMGRL
jgi:hypothetical protein